MRNAITIILIILLAVTFASADTIIPGGNVSGVWDMAGSPYIIQSDISIVLGSTLTINPGVEIRFDSDAGLTVAGDLTADGTTLPAGGDTIRFTSNLPDPQPGDWDGIGLNSNGNAVFTYCSFDYGDVLNLQNTALTDCRISFDVESTQFTRCLITVDLLMTEGGPYEFYCCTLTGNLEFNWPHSTSNRATANIDSSSVGGNLKFLRYGICTVTDSDIGGDLRAMGDNDCDLFATNCIIQGSITNIGSNVISDCIIYGGISNVDPGGIVVTLDLLGCEVYGLIDLYDVYADILDNTAHAGIEITSARSTDVSGNTVYGNLYASGSGMWNYFRIKNNEIISGGITLAGSFYSSQETASGNLVYDSPGDGIRVTYWGSPGSFSVVGNTVYNAGNNGIEVTSGGGFSAAIDVSNNIVSSCGAYGISLIDFEANSVYYNDSWNNDLGNYSGANPYTGCISVDPLFVDPSNGDFHLQSTNGSYHSGMWLPDPQSSPCIDAGNPASPYTNEPPPNGSRINMGAYGNTAEASLSPTMVVSGAVSGVWTYDQSPYYIGGEIWLPADSTLSIEPGVTVVFLGDFDFLVYGLLNAIGTASDSIIFTKADSILHRGNIRFINTGGHIEYCVIQHGYSCGSYLNDRGGGIYCEASDPVISDCTIRWNQAVFGAGIFADGNSSAVISNCEVYENQANWEGAGIHCYGTNNVDNCWIHNNVATQNGGGIRCGGNSIVNHCTVNGNSAGLDGAGIDIPNGANPTISNCLSYGNTAGQFGAGMRCEIASPVIQNCTIANNIALFGWGNGFYCESNGTPELENCIFWNPGGSEIYNVGSAIFSYCAIRGGYPGTGNLDVDPQFVDPANGDYHLQSINASYHGGSWLPDWLNSPCIDAGDPLSPFTNEPAPNGGRINMGAYGNSDEASMSPAEAYPDVVFDIEYISGSPVSVGGGNIYFGVHLENSDSIAVDFDAWIEISYEGYTPFTVVFRAFQNFLPGLTADRDDLWFPISPGYAAGNYMMIAKVGLHPDEWWDASGFPFVKEGLPCGGEFVPYAPEVEFPDPFSEVDELFELVEVPSQFSLMAPFPNPFNPSTDIGFQLPENCRVDLAIYDVSGRKVAELIDGWREAGTHHVTLITEGWASGMYFVKLKAREFTSTQKIILIK